MNYFPDEVIEHIFDFVTKQRDRNAVSLVCKSWYRIERFSRERVVIGNCYAISPERVIARFPGLKSLTLKGKPHFADFNLVPHGWGGSVDPWIEALAESCVGLEELRLKRMVVSDEILDLLSRSFLNFKSLVLVSCEGFTTDGLAAIAANCRFLRELDLQENEIDDHRGHWLSCFPDSCTSLVSLNFACLKGEINLAALVRLVARSPNLKVLRVNHAVPPDTLQKVLMQAPQLVDLGTGSYVLDPDSESSHNPKLNPGTKTKQTKKPKAKLVENMDSMTSFKGYGKVDELEEQAFRRKTRKRFLIVTVSVIVLLAVIIGAVTGTVIHNRNSSSSPSPNTEPATQLTPSASLKAVCGVTQYPSSCFSSISSLKNSNTTDPEALFKLSLHVAIDEASKLKDLPTAIKSKIGNDTKLESAIKVCEAVFDDAVDMLNDSLSAMDVNSGEKLLSPAKINDLKTWISATMTDQETCLDSLEDINSTYVQEFRDAMQNSTEYASNSLAIVAKILGLLSNLNIPVHRRLLGYGGERSSVPEFPGWVSPGDRRLLQEQNLTAHVIVAQDGTGDFKTIQEAVNAVPKKNLTRFVIYVKQGTYEENVIMDKSKWNVMMYGDGKAKTIVSGDLNFVDGTATFNTATFAVAGRGFIAKDIGFINTAGAVKHQAVAFRSGSDQSVYYRCSFDAFQDTLYAHSNRQFYRDCDITGTIDFIFGNAAVVFQNCNIRPRQPMPNQFNTITAQGKKDPNQNSGISIQKCTISPLESNMTALTYLGRPWKEYSTTVFMQSTIGSFLNPAGWKEWVSNVDPPNTIFYAEYQNSGPGSSVDKRVTWTGYRPSLTDTEAAKFTVESFIQGSEWLPQTNVNFETSL